MNPARRKTCIILAALAALPLLVYLPGIGHGFVYDDHGQLEENLFLQNPANVADVLLLKTLGDAKVINGRRPLVLLSYFSDRALWGSRAWGYRLTNLFAHIISMWLFYFLLLRLSERQDFSFWAALLFGLHPVLIEAVHVPAFRPDVFCGLFSFAFLLASLRTCLHVPAVVFLWLALCSKEAAATVPAVLAGIWFCLPRARLPVRRMAVLLAVSAGIVILFMKLSAGSGFQAAGGAWNGRSLQPPHNFLTSPWIFLRMLGLLAAPWPLVADRVVAPVTSLADFRFAEGLLALIACVCAAFFFLRRNPWISIGLGWMLAAFLPVSSLVPLFNPLADRYLYFMAAGFCILPAHLLAENRRAGKYLLALACAIFTVIGWIRMPDWRNDVALWTRTLADEPDSTRARVWLALELKDDGRREEAMKLLDEAIRVNPQDVSGYINRGILWGEMGYYDRAEADLAEAVRRRPESASAHWNMAVMLQFRGDLEGMVREAKKTLELNPSHPQAKQLLDSVNQPAR